MKIYVFSIIIFTLVIIINLITKYLEEKNLYVDKINIVRNKIDIFIEKNLKIIYIIFAVLIFFSRIYKFGEIPKQIGVDEAGAAYDSYCLANYGVDRYLNSYPLYLINFGHGQSVLYAYSTIPFIKIFGTSLIIYRLPELLFYLMGIVASYFLVKKFKDKKKALLFAFLIIICPWNIEASRQGLDCNLLAPMFILDLLVLLSANKNWHYIIAGVLIGITLYTYSLSWILIPAFLVTYIIYMLYMKKINFKQIVLLGIPILIFAIPLMYMLLLNNGIFERTQFGIFTIPKLPINREKEINFSNIVKYGIESLYTIFFPRYGYTTIYFLEFLIFIVGYIVGIKKLIKSIKTKEFDLSGFMILIFTILLITNLLVRVSTTNKANILLLLIIYIILIGFVYLSKKSYLSGIILLIWLTILFCNFEFNYFNRYYYNKEANVYLDNGIVEITNEIKNEKDAKKYFITNSVVQPYIYTLVGNKISPYIFYQSKNINNPKLKYNIASYENYIFIKNKIDINKIEKILNDNENKNIIVIEKSYKNYIDKLKNIKKKYIEKENYIIFKNYD